MKMPHEEQTIPYDAFIRIAEKLLASRMGVKSISGVAPGYRSEFIAAVNQVFRGNITPVALRDRLGTLIEDYAERIFIEGAVEAGSKITPHDLEKEAPAAISSPARPARRWTGAVIAAIVRSQPTTGRCYCRE